MSWIRIASIVALIAMPIWTAGAPTRCECEYDKWVGDCRAAIKRVKNWVHITSNTQQCSRVDWYIDGQPHVTIVTDGVESEELLNISDASKIAIQSCKVCKDAQASVRPGSGQEPSAQQPRVPVQCTANEQSQRHEIRGASAIYGSAGCNTHYVFAFGSMVVDAGGLRQLVSQIAGSLCPAGRTTVEEKAFTEQDWGPRPRHFALVHCGDQSSVDALAFAPLSQYRVTIGSQPNTQSVSPPANAVRSK
jgi:heat shock protein HslJ